jgi:hypothetical protein
MKRSQPPVALPKLATARAPGKKSHGNSSASYQADAGGIAHQGRDAPDRWNDGTSTEGSPSADKAHGPEERGKCVVQVSNILAKLANLLINKRALS